MCAIIEKKDYPDVNNGADGRRRPFFSIIIPVWNREDTIRRCLDSALSQDFDDFEIIAVDDGSKDNSLAILRGYQDSRVKVVALDRNRGMSAARNAGAEASRGLWLLCLDSDDALLPGGLRVCYKAAANASRDVGIVGFGYKSGEGTSPDPFPPEGLVDLPAFLKWKMIARSTDFLNARRRECWQYANWPTTRAKGVLTTLRILSKWHLSFSSRLVGVIFSDASNRNRAIDNKQAVRMLAMAPDFLAESKTVIAEFGPYLRKHSPQAYLLELHRIATFAFLSGERRTGLRYALECLIRNPFSLNGWATLVCGMLGPKVLAKVRVMKSNKKFDLT